MTIEWEWVWVLSWIAALATVPSVLLQREGRPLAALSWLFALFAVPWATLFAWWLFGRTHLRRKRRRRRLASAEIGEKIAASHSRRTPAGSLDIGPITVRTLPASLEHAVFPATGGNKVELLSSSADAYAAWQNAIDGARHHVHALFYAWYDDEIGRLFRDRLAARARDGLEVRVIVDGVGSARSPHRFFRPLTEAGGECAVFMRPRLLSRNPMLNFRNHRKLLIVDGQVAFTGGINVGEPFAAWDDAALAIEGQAVNQLQEVFVDDWYFCTEKELVGGQYFDRAASAATGDDTVVSTIASGPDQRWNAVRDILFLAITESRRRIWLMTPYFIPNDSLLTALRTAVYRGVEVRVVVPVISDHWIVSRATRTFLPDLLRAGIDVFAHPTFSHAKIALFDDSVTLIGSANLDARSFRLNFEISMLTACTRLNAEVAHYVEQRCQRAHAVTRESLRRRALGGRVIDAVAHLMSPLL